MTILLTGGGSGGHITPILAVAEEIKRRNSHIKVVYIGLKGDGLIDIPRASKFIDEVHEVSAGKWRRYHGLGLKQLLDMRTNALNARDAVRVGNGLQQSYRLLKKLQPDLIFTSGGFVSVPVGLAAARLQIPFVTHDLDAHPGLANRIIARWASGHAVAMSPSLYPYPTTNTYEVGVPVSNQFERVSESLQIKFKRELGLTAGSPVLFVTGGGLGAQRLNYAVLSIAPRLFDAFPNLTILHATGRANESEMQAKYQELLPDRIDQIKVKGFLTDLYRNSGAADVVIARAGAMNIAELASQAKTCIIVPNPYLSGGHQLKNAAVLAHEKAVVLLQEENIEDDPKELLEPLVKLLRSTTERQKLSANLAKFAHPDATTRLVDVLFDTLKKSKT